jgi:hypothetical protein
MSKHKYDVKIRAGSASGMGWEITTPEIQWEEDIGLQTVAERGRL